MDCIAAWKIFRACQMTMNRYPGINVRFGDVHSIFFIAWVGVGRVVHSLALSTYLYCMIFALILAIRIAFLFCPNTSSLKCFTR